MFFYHVGLCFLVNIKVCNLTHFKNVNEQIRDLLYGICNIQESTKCEGLYVIQFQIQCFKKIREFPFQVSCFFMAFMQFCKRHEHLMVQYSWIYNAKHILWSKSCYTLLIQKYTCKRLATCFAAACLASTSNRPRSRGAGAGPWEWSWSSSSFIPLIVNRA